MTPFRTFVATMLFSSALVCAALMAAPIDTTRSNQDAENACLNVYNVCYNNCKGKSDTCYSNCDTAYKHCMHGAGVDFFTLKKHPHPVVTGQANTNKGVMQSSSPASGTQRTTTTSGKTSSTLMKSTPTPTPTPKGNNGNKHKG